MTFICAACLAPLASHDLQTCLCSNWDLSVIPYDLKVDGSLSEKRVFTGDRQLQQLVLVLCTSLFS